MNLYTKITESSLFRFFGSYFGAKPLSPFGCPGVEKDGADDLCSVTRSIARATVPLTTAVALVGVLLTACGPSGPKPPPPPAPATDPAKVTWNLEPDGLLCHIEATPDLNLNNNTPLGVSLCVYQLRDSAKFLGVAATASGIDTLLDCTLDRADALSAKTYQLQPGDKRDLTFDRMENARFMAVVAGYAHLQPELCRAVLPFVLRKERQGLLFTPVYSAVPMNIQIRLGAEAVTLTGVEYEH